MKRLRKSWCTSAVKTKVEKELLKKLYLRCQHKQRQTGKHTKSNKALKTTHKQHNNKKLDCPAQIIITLLPPNTRDGSCVAVTLKHTHNHLVNVADALRFRPVSESTKGKYYDLFRQGHSPSSVHSSKTIPTFHGTYGGILEA